MVLRNVVHELIPIPLAVRTAANDDDDDDDDETTISSPCYL